MHKNNGENVNDFSGILQKFLRQCKRKNMGSDFKKRKRKKAISRAQKHTGCPEMITCFSSYFIFWHDYVAFSSFIYFVQKYVLFIYLKL